MIKSSGSMPLSGEGAGGLSAERRFESEDANRIAGAGPGGFQDGPGQRLTFLGTAFMGGVLIA